MSTPTPEMAALDQRKRRASYRAHYRGTKEMDWLVGKFADARLPGMDEGQLTLFEALLAMPDPDLQLWIVEPHLVADRDIGPLVADMNAFHDLRPKEQA